MYNVWTVVECVNLDLRILGLQDFSFLIGKIYLSLNNPYTSALSFCSFPSLLRSFDKLRTGYEKKQRKATFAESLRVTKEALRCADTATFTSMALAFNPAREC